MTCSCMRRAALFAAALACSAAAQAAGPNAYVQTNLVGNKASYNPIALVDENLVNPWGIVLRPPGADGVAQVTGQVCNAASDFAGQPTEFFVQGRAKFVFVTQDGTINAWRTRTDPGMLEAVVVKDCSTIDFLAQGLKARPGFNGVAITTDAWTLNAQGVKVANNRLYAADFAAGRVMSFDNQWNEITASTPFARPADRSEVWHPFNVQVLGDGRVYVAWTENALEIDEPTEEIPGKGRIVAYDVATGADLGYMKDPDGNVISIDGILGHLNVAVVPEPATVVVWMLGLRAVGLCGVRA